jgi:hypothetical protein
LTSLIADCEDSIEFDFETIAWYGIAPSFGHDLRHAILFE